MAEVVVDIGNCSYTGKILHRYYIVNFAYTVTTPLTSLHRAYTVVLILACSAKVSQAREPPEQEHQNLLLKLAVF